MHVVVKKWGNSACVRIPAAVMEATGLQLNETVDVHAEAGRIVMDPVRPITYILERLLEDITDENLHGEVEFGAAAGKEAF